MGKRTRNNIRVVDGQVDRAGEVGEPGTSNGAVEDTVDCGLDISTSVVGVCFLEKTTGKLIKTCSLKLNSTKYDSLWDKADAFAAFIDAEVTLLGKKLSRVFVEANAKRFTPGFSSADTILTLAKFNGICSYIVRQKFDINVVDVNVSSARSKLGLKINRADKRPTKEKVREQLLLLYPNIPIKTHVAKTGGKVGQVVPDVTMADELDACVIVMGGRVIHPC